MDLALHQLYQDRVNEPDTYAILSLEREQSPLSITDGFDAIVLLIKKQAEVDWQVKHYLVNGKTIAFHDLSQEMMHHSLIAGNQRRLVDWLVNGEIVFEREQFLQRVKERIESFPPGDRAKKMTIQFAKMIRRFNEGKLLFQQNLHFDAFSNLMHALHHLARLAVINHGSLPDVTVWEQIKKIEPETYKLYQELLYSKESLEKRIELVILATEFAIHSKVSVGSQHLLTLIESTGRAWTISELMQLPEVQDYKIDLDLLVNFLLEKHYLCVDCKQSGVKGVDEIYYKAKKDYY
ncbi:nucleotidyltransferase-like protein [Halalkalibacter urbisdiaboli]|uniref:nucleotidyltransferase-like protein n=1 Tax=Halalkalibacter urbisdiaboli TaxID=1960589 RepID=UPI000B44B3BD|nr:nucleotidyltransferase-like protein [Halalkalibacter urbisdiaboli]